MTPADESRPDAPNPTPDTDNAPLPDEIEIEVELADTGEQDAAFDEDAFDDDEDLDEDDLDDEDDDAFDGDDPLAVEEQAGGEPLAADFVRGPIPAGHRSGFVALTGRANVGKSTLLNQLIGRKVAIVSNIPQTTRTRILGVRTLPHGQVAFLDSPGFHKPQHQLGVLMMEAARQVAAEADVVLFVIDAHDGVGPGDEYVLDQLDPKNEKRPVICVLNKVDAMNKGRVLPLIDKAVNEWGCREAVPVSAQTGDNVDRLLEVVLKYLPEGPPLYPDDFITDQDERRFIAECVREKLLVGLRQEVPHSIAVAIEHFDVREDGLAEIAAAILVERDSQKGIIIGAKGARLKQVGTAARTELERHLGRRVFLKLWVKVREEWREKTSILRELGMYPG